MKLFYFTIAFIFILIFSIVYFINNFTTKSNISIEELLSNQNLQIDVETDEYGLNTIHFQNEDDFYYLLGIFQSKDRLWQLDYLRRRAEGRLSEVLGEDYIQYDKFIRCFDLKIISKNQYNNLTPNAKHVIDKYTDGVNHFINNNYNNLSIEFNYLGYKPEKWKGSDCIKILLLNSIEQNEVIPIFLKKAKYYNLTNKINNKLSNNIDSISFTKKQKDDMFNHFYNNFIKNKQFENTLNYFSLSSTYNNDYLWQINLNNSIDSNNIYKPNKLINNNTEYISSIKNDVLSGI